MPPAMPAWVLACLLLCSTPSWPCFRLTRPPKACARSRSPVAHRWNDRLAALSALVNSSAPGREEALSRFYQEFREEALVIDKWFMLQAMARDTDLAAVRELASNVPASSLRELARSGAAELGARVEAMTRDVPFDVGDWADPDTWVEAGPIDLGGRVLEAVPTPGHTKGHVVYHDLEAGLLFSGDHVLPTITPSIGFELGDWDLPLGHFLDSLELLLERPDARLMPAHGFPVDSVHERVRALLEHHRVRFDEVRQAVQATGGSASAAQVAERLLWTRRLTPFTDLDDFNRMIAVCETIAHLDVMVVRGDLGSDLSIPVETFRA